MPSSTRKIIQYYLINNYLILFSSQKKMIMINNDKQTFILSEHWIIAIINKKWSKKYAWVWYNIFW